jgi:hypothetical protein
MFILVRMVVYPTVEYGAIQEFISDSSQQQNALFCPTGFRIPDYKT